MDVRGLSARQRSALRPVRMACSIDPDMRARAVHRFAHGFYAMHARSFLLDLILSVGAALGAALLILRHARPVRAVPGVEVVIESADPGYRARYFASVEASLAGVGTRFAGIGEGVEQPPTPTLRIEPGPALRAAIGLVILTPYLFIASLITRTNLLRGTVRTVVVYLRARHYFRSWPTRIFLTYKDNQCSAAFYAGFHDAGGEQLLAAQNGIRFPTDGLDGSCFDHLFALGQAYVEMYESIGGLVKGSTIIGSLRLDNARAALSGAVDPQYDVLAVDQGPPDAPAQHWSTLPPESATRFLEALRTFATTHPELHVAYQLRCYGPADAKMERSIRAALAGSRILVLDGCSELASYHNLRRSRLTLTMNSTLGLEAFPLGVPALFVNYTGRTVFQVVPPPLSVAPHDQAAFDASILNAIDEPAREASYRHFIGENTFIGGRLIAEHIRELLAGGPT